MPEQCVWPDQATPIHDATVTGDIPILAPEEWADAPDIKVQTLKNVMEALGALDLLREDMDRVLAFIEKAGPLLEIAAKYTQGSKLDKARAAIGLRHG